jgi:hypothetical protein
MASSFDSDCVTRTKLALYLPSSLSICRVNGAQERLVDQHHRHLCSANSHCSSANNLRLRPSPMSGSASPRAPTDELTTRTLPLRHPRSRVERDCKRSGGRTPQIETADLRGNGIGSLLLERALMRSKKPATRPRERDLAPASGPAGGSPCWLASVPRRARCTVPRACAPSWLRVGKTRKRATHPPCAAPSYRARDGASS